MARAQTASSDKKKAEQKEEKKTKTEEVKTSIYYKTLIKHN